MPPKKQPMMKDLRSFFPKKSDNPGGSGSPSAESRQPAGATASKTVTGCQVTVKEEKDSYSMVGHLHHFTVKFDHAKSEEYNINCHKPCTVLKAITSDEKYKTKIKGPKENIVIQLGKGDRDSTIATHFPCSCISNGESLIMSFKSEKIEEAGDQHDEMIHPRDKYSVFYIDRDGGLNTKTKKLFRSSAVRQFKRLCVYGETGMTVKEALKRDGRFIDSLCDFHLSDNENPNILTACTQTVDNLDGKVFKIRSHQNKRENDEKQQKNPGASASLRRNRPLLEVVRQSGISVKRALEEKADSSSDTEEISEILRQQFPDLKKWMEERFPRDSFQEALTLKKENFGKIQQSFSEVHRVRKLLNLGKSVCKVVVENVCQGTGFVLFDNFILTNAHLFERVVRGQKLHEDVNVFALFDYDGPEPVTDFYYFSCEKTFIDSDNAIDYAILELNPEGQQVGNKNGTGKLKVPPGLLKKFGRVPQSGEACIIGHPEGGVKKMDPTCVIEKEAREQAVSDHIHPYKDSMFIVQSIIKVIQDQGIANIMKGGDQADKVVTYNTFMYGGSSGSPVFDAHCRVFGLHSAGFDYGFPKRKVQVIEFAHPLLTIFEKVVGNLKEKGNQELLKRFEEKAKGNEYLEEVLQAKSAGQ